MKMQYHFDSKLVDIRETVTGNDSEFIIRVADQSFVDSIRGVQKKFEENTVHTDVLFYAYPNHEYRIIVRNDYYDDFLTELLKQRLLTKLEWIDI